MTSDPVEVWTKVATAVVGLLTFLFVALTYSKTAVTKRAEFIISLHNAFFRDQQYQPMKTILDCDGDEEDANLEATVAAQKSEFTDFLNFFELIAYLVESETLEADDAEALLGYYFDRLYEKQVVRDYINRRRNGFEKLSRYLADRRQG